MESEWTDRLPRLASLIGSLVSFSVETHRSAAESLFEIDSGARVWRSARALIMVCSGAVT